VSNTRTGNNKPGNHVPDWRAAAPFLLAVFVVSRMLVISVAAFVETLFPLEGAHLSYSTAPFLTSLTTSDAVYYLGIAAQGYHAQPVSGVYNDWVFFPLFPILTRIGSWATFGDVALAGVLVSNVAFAIAIVLLYRISAPQLGHDGAVRAVTYVALAPGAVAFAMAYSDSLFLALSLGAFIAAEKRRYRLTGVLYGLAALTRPYGLILGLPLLVLIIRNEGRRPTRDWLWLAIGPIAVIGFYLYLGQVTGDPLASIHGQAAWDEPRLSPIQGGSIETRGHPLWLILFAVLLTYTFLLVYLRTDHVPPAHAAYAILTLSTVLLSGRFLSLPRYLNVAWPFSWSLAARVSPWFQQAWLALWAGLFVLFAFLNFTTMLAP